MMCATTHSNDSILTPNSVQPNERSNYIVMEYNHRSFYCAS